MFNSLDFGFTKATFVTVANINLEKKIISTNNSIINSKLQPTKVNIICTNKWILVNKKPV